MCDDNVCDGCGCHPVRCLCSGTPTDAELLESLAASGPTEPLEDDE